MDMLLAWHNVVVIRLALLLLVGSTAVGLGKVPFIVWRDRDCGTEEHLIALLEGAAVYARCDNTPAEQIMHLAVENRSDKPLTGFAIGFCGDPIIASGATSDWQSRRNSSANFDIEVADPAQSVAPGKRVDGFPVTLSRPWKRSGEMHFYWSDGVGMRGAGVGGSDGCVF